MAAVSIQRFGEMERGWATFRQPSVLVDCHRYKGPPRCGSGSPIQLKVGHRPSLWEGGASQPVLGVKVAPGVPEPHLQASVGDGSPESSRDLQLTHRPMAFKEKDMSSASRAVDQDIKL